MRAIWRAPGDNVPLPRWLRGPGEHKEGKADADESKRDKDEKEAKARLVGYLREFQQHANYVHLAAAAYEIEVIILSLGSFYKGRRAQLPGLLYVYVFYWVMMQANAFGLSHKQQARLLALYWVEATQPEHVPLTVATTLAAHDWTHSGREEADIEPEGKYKAKALAHSLDMEIDKAKGDLRQFWREISTELEGVGVRLTLATVANDLARLTAWPYDVLLLPRLLEHQETVLKAVAEFLQSVAAGSGASSTSSAFGAQRQSVPKGKKRKITASASADDAY
jgi:hypothetical protein